MLTNLVSNSVKFTDEGGVYLHVDAPDDETWQVTVRDTGAGMPEGSEAFIFDKFQQLSNNNNKDYKGTGLGLAIVKGFIELMDGQISLNSKLGEGTSFTIQLPRDRRKDSLANLQKGEIRHELAV